jgi:hypothetical protein
MSAVIALIATNNEMPAAIPKIVSVLRAGARSTLRIAITGTPVLKPAGR